MKRFCFKNKARKSQQLLEFLLIAPFLIMVLAMLTEYVYALNINMTLREGLRTVTSSLYSEMRPGITQAQIRNLVQYNLASYLQNNNVPVSTTNPTVGFTYSTPNSTAATNQTAVFAATYTYNVAFTLPNIYNSSGRFSMFPNSFTFFTTVAVPSAFLTPNNYPVAGRITSVDLDRIWSFTSDFSSTDGPNLARDGIMRNTDATLAARNRGYMLFMAPWSAIQATLTATKGSAAVPYVPIAWDGLPYHSADNSRYYVLDLNSTTTNLYICTKVTPYACTAVTNWTLLNFVRANKPANTGYATSGDSTVMFFPNTAAYDLSAITPAAWISGAATTGNLAPSPDNVTGLLKSTISLNDTTGASVGNYDNLNVSGYNSSFAASSYTYRPFGSIAFIYPNTLTTTINTYILPASITTIPDYTYEFNG